MKEVSILFSGCSNGGVVVRYGSEALIKPVNAILRRKTEMVKKCRCKLNDDTNIDKQLTQLKTHTV